jgi:hypothetical protein
MASRGRVRGEGEGALAERICPLIGLGLHPSSEPGDFDMPEVPPPTSHHVPVIPAMARLCYLASSRPPHRSSPIVIPRYSNPSPANVLHSCPSVRIRHHHPQRAHDAPKAAVLRCRRRDVQCFFGCARN